MSIATLKSMVIAGVLAGTIGLAAELPFSSEVLKNDRLARQFQTPPDSARPWVFWFWSNGLVTREGITADLEAMKRVGIGGAHLMDVGYGPLAGFVKYNEPGWHELLKFSAAEAQRLGLELAIHNSPGWSGSGGPWIKPENGMKVVVTSELQVEGPCRFDQQLAVPMKAHPEFYRDIAVLAFPTPAAETVRLSSVSPTVTLSTPGEEGAKLLDGQTNTLVKLNLPTRDQPQFVQLDCAQPFTAATLSLTMVPGFWSVNGRLEASQDGQQYETVTEFSFTNRDKESPLTYSFEPVAAKFYRIIFTQGSTMHSSILHLGVAEVDLSPRLGIAGLNDKLFRQRFTRGYYVEPTLSGAAEFAVQGVKYFSGTATCRKSFDCPWTAIGTQRDRGPPSSRKSRSG